MLHFISTMIDHPIPYKTIIRACRLAGHTRPNAFTGSCFGGTFTLKAPYPMLMRTRVSPQQPWSNGCGGDIEIWKPPLTRSSGPWVIRWPCLLCLHSGGRGGSCNVISQVSSDCSSHIWQTVFSFFVQVGCQHPLWLMMDLHWKTFFFFLNKYLSKTVLCFHLLWLFWWMNRGIMYLILVHKGG